MRTALALFGGDQRFEQGDRLRERLAGGLSNTRHADPLGEIERCPAVRVFRLPQRMELPMRPSYGGCKSWIELEQDIDTVSAAPVLGEAQFKERLKQFETSLDAVHA